MVLSRVGSSPWHAPPWQRSTPERCRASIAGSPPSTSPRTKGFQALIDLRSRACLTDGLDQYKQLVCRSFCVSCLIRSVAILPLVFPGKSLAAAAQALRRPAPLSGSALVLSCATKRLGAFVIQTQTLVEDQRHTEDICQVFHSLEHSTLL